MAALLFRKADSWQSKHAKRMGRCKKLCSENRVVKRFTAVVYLHDVPLAVLACDREGESEALRNVVGAIG